MPSELYYLHAVNPHAGAEFADLYFEGKHFGITQTETPPISQVQFILYIPDNEIEYALTHNEGKLIDQRKKYPPSAAEAKVSYEA